MRKSVQFATAGVLFHSNASLATPVKVLGISKSQEKKERKIMTIPDNAINYGYFIRYALREEMRTLRDTELRVFLTVADKTLGWGKETDWISRKQLKEQTGKGNTALANAITILTSKGFIDACDEHGKILRSPRERQLYGYTRHNTYLRINPALIQKAIEHWAKKRTLTRSHSKHYKSISPKLNSPQIAHGEDVNTYEGKNEYEILAKQVTDWMTREIFSIKKPYEELYLQVLHSIQAYGVTAINGIYNSVANKTNPGHPREFWNEMRKLKRPETYQPRTTPTRSFSNQGFESIGSIMGNYTPISPDDANNEIISKGANKMLR